MKYKKNKSLKIKDQNEELVSQAKQTFIDSLKGQNGLDGDRGEKGDKGEQGKRGFIGQIGDTGNSGTRGEKGEKGDKGDKGDTGNDGEDGEDGEDGRGIVNTVVTRGDLIIQYTDDTKQNAGRVVGPQGPRGLRGLSGSVIGGGGGGGTGSGTVTQVNTGTGLEGGPITTTGTIKISDTSVVAGSYDNANFTVNAQGQITFAEPSDPTFYAQNNVIAGVMFGGEITVNAGDNTKFDIAFGLGVIPDWTDPQLPTWNLIVIPTSVGLSVPDITALYTTVEIDINGAVVMTTATIPMI